MADEMHDSWKTGSGLPEDIDITITDFRVEWGEPFKEGRNAGEEPCRVVFVYEDEDGDAGEMFLNTGKGWDPGPKGESITREDGKKRAKFNNSAPFGYWVNGVTELDDAVKALGSLDTTKKATWVGTKWHIMRTGQTRTIGGNEVTFERVYPSAYLGRVGDKGKGGSKTGSSKATTSTDEDSEASTKESVDNSAPSGKLLIKLTKLAGEHDNHEDWAAAALEDETVSGNTQYTEWVMDEANYATLTSE